MLREVICLTLDQTQYRSPMKCVGSKSAVCHKGAASGHRRCHVLPKTRGANSESPFLLPLATKGKSLRNGQVASSFCCVGRSWRGAELTVMGTEGGTEEKGKEVLLFKTFENTQKVQERFNGT